MQEPAAADHDVCTEEPDSEEEMVEEELEEAAATLELGSRGEARQVAGSPPWPRRPTRLPTAIRKGRLRGWFACSTTASARADVRLGAYGTASAQLSARKLDSLIGRLIKLNWIGRCFCSQMVVVVRGAGVANSAISVLLGLGLLRWLSLAPG